MSAARLRFAKNAVANVVSGLAAAMLTVILPHFFVHDFPRPEFSLWILILQLGNFMNVLNLGLSVAIGRHVAVAVARGERREAEIMIGAGIQILLLAMGLGLAVLLALDAAMPLVFHHIPANLRPTAQHSLLWIGGALALGLPASGLAGGMIGLQRNEVPAMVNIISKATLGVSLAVIAGRTHRLEDVAEGFFAVSLLGYALQFAAFRLVCRGWRMPLGRGLGAARRELARYCVSLSVWSAAMLLVTGVDTSIVGVFDYRAVAAYGLAANLGVFFSGAVNTALNPLIQIFAGYHARGDMAAVLRLLNIASFACTLGLLLAGLWLVALAHFGFTVWVGRNLAYQAFPFFCLLVASNTIRNSATPYALYLLGSGQQQRVMLTPLLEGLANFGCSLLGAWAFGAIGVAVGAVVGAVVGFGTSFLYNMPRTLPASFNRLIYLRNDYVLPISLAIPCLMVTFWLSGAHASPAILLVALCGASLIVLWPAWRFCRAIPSIP